MRISTRPKYKVPKTHRCVIVLDKPALLVRIAAFFSKVQRVMLSFCLKHVLALDIMRELGWSDVLTDGFPQELQK